MRETLRLLTMAVALGAITTYGSETLFWSYPPAGLNVVEYLLTVVAYALVSATVLSAVILTGASGWRGFWLAGAMLGFLVEGVLVGEMYEAFPFQLVWTPLAWHMLLTAGVILAVPRLAMGWRPGQQCLMMIAVGLGAGLWASYWPLEQAALPGIGAFALYQMAGGTLALLGFVALDRIGPLPQPPRGVLWVMPALAGLLFVAQSVADPRPQRIFLPLMLGLTLWAMTRAKGGARPVLTTQPVARYLPFLLVPATTVAMGAGLVAATGGLAVNIVLAAVTVPLGLGLWLWQVFRRA